MKLAVIQHRLRETADEDARALADAAERAAGMDAALVVLPEVLALHDRESVSRRLLTGRLAAVAAFCLMPDVGPECLGGGFVSKLPRTAGLPEGLVDAALLVGDACMDAAELARASSERPSLAVLSPRSENDLQAEAVLELALGLSYSLAGLVLVAECSGAEPGEPGHGGSAILFLGDLLAEAVLDEDILLAEVALPIQQPEPMESLPDVPPILVQRLAHHRGQKVEQPYPADLS